MMSEPLISEIHRLTIIRDARIKRLESALRCLHELLMETPDCECPQCVLHRALKMRIEAEVDVQSTDLNNPKEL